MWRQLTNVVRELWQASTPQGGSSYRPDLHYMRGPGPKWRARHAGFLTASAAAVGGPGSHEAEHHQT